MLELDPNFGISLVAGRQGSPTFDRRTLARAAVRDEASAGVRRDLQTRRWSFS